MDMPNVYLAIGIGPDESTISKCTICKADEVEEKPNRGCGHGCLMHVSMHLTHQVMAREAVVLNCVGAPECPIKHPCTILGPTVLDAYESTITKSFMTDKKILECRSTNYSILFMPQNYNGKIRIYIYIWKIW
ncbi:unnamed protein product [Arabis nemorensis]|uniref:Uncharacterized protein n=1 Tax=Arabis nemorensis TaxID=586526 RepID=A0A565C5S5_9BRAS|nr:unnamed protein product [Arabis nemorensis]